MDYDAEQAQELEILESIYTEEEFEKLSPTDFRIRVIPDTDKPDPRTPPKTNLIQAHFSLHVILPPTYPEVIPDLSLSLTTDSPRSPIPKDQYPELLATLLAAAQDNLGMAMIFTLVSILKEILEESLLSTEAKARESQRIASEKEKQRLRDEVEDQIGKTLRRTPVTYELFLEWKGRFDAWKVEQARRGVDVENVRGRNREKERREENRLTGREVFERMKAETEEWFEEGEEDGLVERQREDDVDVVAGEMGVLKVGD